MATINQIEQDGVVYQFVDSTARNQLDRLATRVETLNDAQEKRVDDEKDRAMAAEKAIAESTIPYDPTKGLSSNDFTDEYKGFLDGRPSFTSSNNAFVPAPNPENSTDFVSTNLYLGADGRWTMPKDTTYEEATHTVAGLMSALDKVKLDNAKMDVDDEVASTTVFNGNVITETLANGRTKKTTFNSNGSIKEEITSTVGAAKITLVTTFNADGSITRTRS